MILTEVFLKNKRVQKALLTKPGEEGFSLIELVVVIAVLAILSAVAIPAFNGVSANARASAVKNGLVNGIKECVIRQADNQSTTPHTVVQSFPGNFSGYGITRYTGGGRADSCFNAYATADAANTGEADFAIDYSAATGVVTKWCEDGGMPGCEGSSGSAGTW